jgi:DNA-binding SARP family transcriptional activator
MDFRILGPLEVHEGGRRLSLGGARQRALLALLLLRANEAVTADSLIDDLWGETPPATARKALQVHVSTLRKEVGPERILTGPAGYTIVLEPEELDLDRFERLRSEARDAFERSDATGAAARLRDALGLWRGRPLADVGYESFAQAEIARLEELRLTTLEERIEADLALGRHTDLVAELEALVSAEPLRERLRGQLILALYRSGRQAEALEEYQAARRALVEELGIEPSRSLQELQQAILAQDRVLDAAAPRSTAVSTKTVTVLFTDLVGSTELFSSLEREAADQLRRTFFSLQRDAVAATGGIEVKSLGDGLMVVFSSVSAALDCANAMQQQIDRHARRHDLPLSMRIGISHGEALEEEGDYHGAPVIEAARLCAAAEGGQIFVADLLRMLAGQGDRDFEQLGGLRLKGLPEPLPVSELRWAPLVARPPPVPLPERISSARAGRLFGRSAEHALLRAALERASDGERQVALIAGEPGIGKTRLAAEVAAEGHAAGATVLYGRCDEEIGPPYQPFVEAVGHYVQHAGEDLLARHLSTRTAELARLVPELGGRVDEDPRSDGEPQPYLLFAAVGALFASASRDRPIVLVLDDLHWAAKPTVLMLRQLISSNDPMNLLVLGTYRSTEPSDDQPIGELLAALHREPGVTRVSLEGLDGPEVVELVGAAAGHDLDDAEVGLAQALHRETDGNPFFVQELFRHLAESPAEPDGQGALADPAAAGLPVSAREVIAQRVVRVGPGAQQVLSLAAVIGHEFDLDLLSRVADMDEEELLDVLDGAVRAALLSEAPGTAPRFSFTHALIEHSLYDALGPARRGRAHRRVAEGLEALCGDHPGPRIGELAHHWLRASPADAARTIEYARRAGDHALGRLAPQAAARWYRDAVELLDQQPGAREEQRCELLIGLGDAQRQSGDPAFRETLLEACQIARRHGDTDRLVRAVLANNRGFVSASGEVDDERVGALEAAIASIGARDDARRARLLATLGAELAFSGDWERRLALANEALTLARQHGDEATLSQVLTLRFVTIWAPETLSERLANTAENVALADRLGDPVAQFGAVHWRGVACVQAGEMKEAARAIEREARLAERLGQPTARWIATYDRANLHQIAGRLDDAEGTAGEAFQIALDSGQPDAQSFYASQIVSIRFEQGRLAELQPLIASTVADNPGIPGFRAVLALACCEADLDGEARSILSRESNARFADFHYDPTWLAVMVLWADVAAHLGDVEAAAQLYERLSPWPEQFAFTGLGANGAVSRALGLLAATLGRDDEAESRLADALALHERMAAPVWVARTRVDTARLLLARAAVKQAAPLLDEARRNAEKLGCAGIERRAVSLARYADAIGDLGTPAGTREP